MRVHLSFFTLLTTALTVVSAAPAGTTTPKGPAAPATGPALASNNAAIKKAATYQIEDYVIMHNCGYIKDPLTKKDVSAEGQLVLAVQEVEKLVALAEISTKAPAKSGTTPAKKSPFERLFKPTSKAAFTKALNDVKKPVKGKGRVVLYCQPDAWIPSTPLKKSPGANWLANDDGAWIDDGRKLMQVKGKEHPSCKPGSKYYIEPFTNRVHLCSEFWKAAASVEKACPGPEARSNELRAFYLLSALFETPLLGGSPSTIKAETTLKVLETKKPAKNGPSYAWAGVLQYREGRCPAAEECPAGSGQTMNAKTKKCECPAGSGQTLDAKTKKCACPAGQTLDAKTKKCGCAAGQKLNPTTKKCEKAVTCPAGQTLDAKTNACNCPAGQILDANTKKCGCAAGQKLNATTKKCEKAVTCPAGQTLDPKTNTCSCPVGTTLNANTKKCEKPTVTCAPGQKLDPKTNKCVVDTTAQDKKKAEIEAKKAEIEKKKAALEEAKKNAAEEQKKKAEEQKKKDENDKKCKKKGLAGLACKVLRRAGL